MKKTVRLSSDMAFSDWASYWLESTAGFRVMTTDARYEELLKTALLPFFGGMKLCEIQEETVLCFLGARQASGTGASGIRQVFSLLSMIMTSAVNHRLLERNPCLPVRVPRKLRSESAILCDRDILRLERDFADHRYLPMILAMLFLGLRVGEAIGLTWEKVNLYDRTVEISQQSVSYYRGGRTVTELVPYTKNRVIRILPLCERVHEILNRLSQKPHLPQNRVFTEPDGDPVLYAAFYYEFNKLMRAIGREDVHPHGLRHTAASTLLFTTGDLLLVKEFLGHRSVRTSERYPEATEQEKLEVADVLDRFFRQYVTDEDF